MTTDTLDDGRIDCEGGVMPCPSCASICHQVMRLCPYLTPDRVQFDEYGDPTPHVSQYGGHPAFYCPLENIHASDPAYTSDCSRSQMTANQDPDYVHNLCAADARFMSKRSAAVETTRDVHFYIPHYSSCCWTYASSLVQDSAVFHASVDVDRSGFYKNRVILNCCDEVGNCDSSDPEGSLPHLFNVSYSNTSLSSSPTPPSSSPSPGSPTVYVGGTLRTANNQVRGEDGKFRELSNAYLHDEGIDDDEEDDDEEYYDDSSAGSEVYSSSGGSSNERPYDRKNRFYVEESSSSVISIHRDNKIYSTRESRSVHEDDSTFYMEHDRLVSSSSHQLSSSASSLEQSPLTLCLSNLVGMVISVLLPPTIVSVLLVSGWWSSGESIVCVCSIVMATCCGVLRPAALLVIPVFRMVLVLGGLQLLATLLTRMRRKDGVIQKTTRSSSRVVRTIGYLLVDNKLLMVIMNTTSNTSASSRIRCSCCEYLRFVSNYSNLIMNLPINYINNIRLSHRKLVVNNRLIIRSTRVVVIRRVGRVREWGVVNPNT